MPEGRTLSPSKAFIKVDLPEEVRPKNTTWAGGQEGRHNSSNTMRQYLDMLSSQNLPDVEHLSGKKHEQEQEKPDLLCYLLQPVQDSRRREVWPAVRTVDQEVPGGVYHLGEGGICRKSRNRGIYRQEQYMSITSERSLKMVQASPLASSAPVSLTPLILSSLRVIPAIQEKGQKPFLLL